ncbi:hypothetical protein ACGFU4_29250 [Streptomyces sp. NPDC048511]|uniref:hypothetical protein n=1 Tax=Streptomyces sp. NPDC048511 TaxID=3365562 RepID=UPI0037121FD5
MHVDVKGNVLVADERYDGAGRDPGLIVEFAQGGVADGGAVNWVHAAAGTYIHLVQAEILAATAALSHVSPADVQGTTSRPSPATDVTLRAGIFRIRHRDATPGGDLDQLRKLRRT